MTSYQEDDTYDLGSVFTPEASESLDIGRHTDEMRACSTSDELGRDDFCASSAQAHTHGQSRLTTIGVDVSGKQPPRSRVKGPDSALRRSNRVDGIGVAQELLDGSDSNVDKGQITKHTIQQTEVETARSRGRHQAIGSSVKGSTLSNTTSGNTE